MTPTPRAEPPELSAIVARLRAASHIVVSSHERPDGDAIGSGMALVLALRALGKDAHLVMCDTPPPSLAPFPAVNGVWVAREIATTFDAAVIMECSDLSRTGVCGLDLSPMLNIDHHPGNARYGVVNWVDESAAACGELVYDLCQSMHATHALRAMGRLPAPHTPSVHPDPRGHIDRGVAAGQQRQRPMPSALQLLRTPRWSHPTPPTGKLHLGHCFRRCH